MERPFTQDSEHSLETVSDHRLAQISVLFLVVLTVLLLGTRELFDVETHTLVVVYLLAMVSFFGMLALRSKEAMAIFEKLLSTLKSSGKEK
jgi:hypothetical protein